jgi:hypothetical protein
MRFARSARLAPAAPLPQVRRLFERDPARRLQLVSAAWTLAVGPELRRRTRPETFERGVLRVRVPDGQWRKVLHRMQPQVIARLHDVLGDMAPRRLSFVEGPVAEATPTPPAPPAPVPPARRAVLPEPVRAAAAAIADDEIRRRFEQTAARYLARPQTPEEI